MSSFPKCKHGKGDATNLNPCQECYVEDLEQQLTDAKAEIEKLKTPVNGHCLVCGGYLGDTDYYRLTDGKEIAKDGE